MKAAVIALIAACALGQAARAEDVVPSTLVIGYEAEGKVDAGPQACLAAVREVTEWDKAATERGAKDVCAESITLTPMRTCKRPTKCSSRNSPKTAGWSLPMRSPASRP
jgi:hypothetical protein